MVLNNNIYFPDSLDKNNMLTRKQVKEMSDIVSFQSHTISHCDLTKVDDIRLEKELKKSKDEIFELTNNPVFVFAYPTGYYNDKVLSNVKKYYEFAVTNKNGYYDLKNDFEIKRVYYIRFLDLKVLNK